MTKPAITRHHVLFVVAGGVLITLLALPLFPYPSFPVPGWIAWLGRLHPLVVHFPVALVPLLVIIEAVCYLRPAFKLQAQSLIFLFWFLAVASALLSVALGYFLFGSGDYGGELAVEHFRGGVITASLMIIAAFLSFATFPQKDARLQSWYRVLLAFSLLGIIYTGHHGGMLTHGAAFITEAIPLKLDEVSLEDKPREDLLVFDDLIFPILEQRCMGCHNANKTKGGLEMTSFQKMQAGGDSEKTVIMAHQPSESELYNRITLPAEDEDRMPPEGKTPLTTAETKLILWWIEQGASPEMKFNMGPADSTQNARLNRLVDSRITAQRRRVLKQHEVEELARLVEDAMDHLIIKTDPATQNRSLAVSMQIPPMHVDDNTISKLISLTDQITSLSLVGSEVTDDALYHIARLPELQALYLAYTSIDGTGLAYLKEAPSLKLLNISGTRVTSQAALHLTRMPALEEVYLHNTSVDSVMVDALRTFMPDVEVSVGVGPIHY